MHLKESNVKTTFVSSGYPENRSRMYLKVKEDDNNFENEFESDEEDFDGKLKKGKEVFNISGRQGKFQVAGTTIHEKYENRPNILEEIWLAQFATSYEKMANKPKKDIDFENGASIAV